MKSLCYVSAVALAVAFALPAAAQSSSTSSQTGTTNGSSAETSGTMAKHPGTMNESGHMSASNQHIMRRMTAELEKSGFTDVHIMPESFLIRAKDSQGNPVMMVVNPDSVMAMTAVGGTGSHSWQPHGSSTASSGAGSKATVGSAAPGNGTSGGTAGSSSQ